MSGIGSAVQADAFDAAVVGAGFAGLTAARELAHAGKRVLVLEGRDRIGGRTWLTERMGLDLELGGTWVHWVQPFVWSELRRYGIGIVPSPTPQSAYWWDGRRAEQGSPDALLALLDEPNRLLTARAREIFPLPFSPLSSPALDEVDETSVQEQIARLNLSAEQRSLLESFWTLNFNGRLTQASYATALRWAAWTSGDWRINFEACASYKVAGGTRALAEAIRADTDATFELAADVRRIEMTEDGVTVRIADGREYHANDAIVTVPLHALGRIEFEPTLSETRRTAIERGQVGLGTKVWFTLEGEREHFVALGGADWTLNFFQSEYTHGGRTYVIGFGPDASAIDVGDREAVQAVLRRLVPDAVVLESTGHDWVGDPLSQETWPVHRPGFLTGSLAELQQASGRVHLAGSDLANGWSGFIDGAIESGLTAARRVLSGASQEALVLR